jgi:anti-sigma-K factor RskA
MRRIIGTIGAVAATAVAAVAIAGLGDRTQTYEGTVDAATARGASVELEVSDDGATIVSERLPEPRPGEEYQVWLKRPGVDHPEPTSTLFQPRGDGSVTVQALASGNVEEVLVTSEPKAGSNEPSGQPVLTIPQSEFVYFPRKSNLELLMRSARL